MNPLFPASNANAYTGGFDPSESSTGGTSTRTTPTMSADFGGFNASAAWANGGDAYSPRVAYDGATWANGSFNAANHMRVPDAPLPPSSFDPEYPFAELYPAMQDRRFDAAYANGSLDGGVMNLSLVPPQVGVAPPYAFAHAPVPDTNANIPFHAMYPGMQHPVDFGVALQRQMAAPNPSYPVYQAPPHTPAAFDASFERSHTGYPNFASPDQYQYLPPPPVDMSAQPPTAMDEFQRVAYEHEHHDAGSLGVHSPLVPTADVNVPPARGRKGKAKKSTAKAKTSRPRKQKDVAPPAAPVAGSSRLVDDDGYAAHEWRNLDAQSGIPSFLALQNANIDVQHAPLAPSVRGGYPDGDVQDSDNNDIVRGQSQGLSVGDQSAPPSTWTGPGASKAEQVRDGDGRLAVHELIPEVERQPPVPGKGVIVCKPPPKGKDLYCHQCWLAKRVVFWQDSDGLRKHNRTKHSTERGDNSVPHACILECGWSKRSTQATHFVEHRMLHCKRYRELKKDGGRALEDFLTERKLHGHWQLKGKRKA